MLASSVRHEPSRRDVSCGRPTASPEDSTHQRTYKPEPKAVAVYERIYELLRPGAREHEIVRLALPAGAEVELWWLDTA